MILGLFYNEEIVVDKKKLPKYANSITCKPTQSTKAHKFKLADMRTILSMDMLQHGFSISTIPVSISYQNLVQFSRIFFCQLFINKKNFEGEMSGFCMLSALL